MNSRRVFLLCLPVIVSLSFSQVLRATDPPPPVISEVNSAGPQKNLRVTPYPTAQAYTFYSVTDLRLPFTVNTNFFLAPYVTGYTPITYNSPTGQVTITVTNFAYEWRLSNATAPAEFYRVGVTPLSSNAVLTATLLNRLAYGPTPDELERVTAMGSQAYIDEQLNMDGILETSDGYTVQITNSIPSDPTTNWNFISLTGTLSTTLYMYMTQPGSVAVDDVELRPLIYTNGVFSEIGTNLLVNGNFESALTPSWTINGAASASSIATEAAHSGAGGLRFASSAAGNTSVNKLQQTISTTLASTNRVVLSFWYRPNTNSSKLTLRLGSGSGLISSAGGLPGTPTWVYAKATGTATATPQLYIYLSGAGDCYVDDLKLVAGTVPEAGANLVQNGDFESALTGPWTKTTDFTNSAISSSVAHSGSGSLHLVATAAGGGSGDSVYQVIPSLVNGQTYTISYWYKPSSPDRALTVRLSGSLLVSTPDTDTGGLYRRLQTFTQNGIGDYRAWYCLHAVNSPRQLFEVLSQFWENHFVTQYSKSQTYFTDTQGYDGTTASRLATDWEFREMNKWRNAMLNPNCTFYDLLKIHVESPAEIVYLDSVNSRGDANSIANENYARELLELFTMGVDNGYDQNDIVLMSRAWTGWTVQLVDAVNANNPFAPASITYSPGTNSTAKINTVGVWAFNFNASRHGTNRGAIFGGKTVPARFGPPWAGRPYQIVIPARTTGNTNGIQDGYDVITNLAYSPFTAEFISVKLCRLFVHDDFPNPNTTDPTSSGYTFYDYTNPNRSAEAELVHQCMLAWENSTPKGNIRAVLNTIFSSDLFRTHAANAQKVKTPLEFVASSVRALRSMNANGTATASTDGFSFSTRLSNMGLMNLFDRAEPDGYPEVGPSWISAGTLVERIRYIQALCNSGTGDDAGNHVCDPVGLLKKKVPAGSWDNAGAVADYFLSILYPGEGAGNLSLYRTAAINFLNTADSGTTSSPFNTLGNTTTNYDTRLRGMVAMLMTFPRFQEQ